MGSHPGRLFLSRKSTRALVLCIVQDAHMALSGMYTWLWRQYCRSIHIMSVTPRDDFPISARLLPSESAYQYCESTERDHLSPSSQIERHPHRTSINGLPWLAEATSHNTLYYLRRPTKIPASFFCTWLAAVKSQHSPSCSAMLGLALKCIPTVLLPCCYFFLLWASLSSLLSKLYYSVLPLP